MKNNSIILIIAVLMLAPLGINLFAQNSPTLPVQKEAIAKLANLMVGEWSGSGWNKKGQAPAEPVDVKESILLKSDGTTLLVQGKGTHPESKKIAHDALAIIYYDAESNTYQFDSHLSSGQHKISTGTLEDNIFTWGFDLPNNATIRYTLTFGDDTWHEVGEYSPSKDVWYKFFEMNLNKL